MLPKTYLTQILLPRLAEARTRLEKQIWAAHGGPYEVWITQPTREHRRLPEVRQAEFQVVERLPHTWGERHDQCWWQLPQSLAEDARTAGGTLYLDWRDDGEATLYADGIPWHGIDPGHPLVRLPTTATDLKIESACIRSGVWVPGNRTTLKDSGSEFKGAYTFLRNDAAWRCWIALDLFAEYIDHEIRKQYSEHPATGGSAGYRPTIERIPPLVRRLARSLDDAVDVLDTAGIEALETTLQQVMATFSSTDPHRLRCVLTGHAHLDLVWLWPERVGEFKAVHTFSTINRLMEQYPEFTFGYSQPASYEAVARRTPELLEEVKGHIAEGRWEAEGASYVESDTQLACGESLVRSFLIGQKGFEELIGNPSTTLWLPDVFGYSGCLPQIMSQTGVTRFFTTKLTWCSVSRFPHSSFRWLAPDGTEVLVHVTQAYGYIGQVKPKEIDDGQLHYQQSDVHDAYLAPTGWGDGGGGPTDIVCERARILRDFAGTPKVEWGRIDDFFAGLEKVREKLPSFQGELYLEYHRGVQTTHGDLKHAFRCAERGMQVWEAAHCACAQGPVDEAVWKRVVLAQFHDYIPGSSIKEVYEEGVPELAAIASKAQESAAAALSATGQQQKEAVFNPLAVAITVFDSQSGCWCRLPPLTGSALEDLEPVQPVGTVSVSETTLSNDRVEATFDDLGRILSLKIDRQAVPFTAPAAELVVYPDFPHAYDAWDIDRSSLSLPDPVLTPVDVNVTAAADGHCGSVSFARKTATGSLLTTRYLLNATDSVLRIEYDVDWQDPQTLLKVLFPTDYRGRHARYGAPFGSSLRVQQPARPDDEAQFENPFSRWIEVSDDAGNGGFFVVSESKYGATVFRGNIQVSLLRSAFVSHPDLAKPAEMIREKSRYSDIGRHQIRLAIGRTGPCSPREEQAAVLADSLFTVPVSYQGNAVSAGLLGIEGLPTLHPCWAKPAEMGNGAWILRCHETHGARGKIKLNLRDGYVATAVDLMEKPADLQVDEDGACLVRPYALVSFLIQPAPSR